MRRATRRGHDSFAVGILQAEADMKWTKREHVWESGLEVGDVKTWGIYVIEPPPTKLGRYRLTFYPEAKSRKRPRYLSVWDTLADAKQAAKSVAKFNQ